MIQVLAGAAGSVRAGPGVLSPDTSAPSDQTDTLPKSLRPPGHSALPDSAQPRGSVSTQRALRFCLKTRRTMAAAVRLTSRVRLFVIPCTAAHQAPLLLTVSPSFPKFDSCYPDEKQNWFPSAGNFSNKQEKNNEYFLCLNRPSAGGGWIQTRVRVGGTCPRQ